MGPRQRLQRKRSKTHAVPIIICSVFGFFVIAMVAFCVGMLANIESWLSDLPDYTDESQFTMSEPTTILDADDNVIATFYIQNRTTITIDEVSEYVIQGTVDVEDERFYEHNGIDIIGIARALVSQLTGGSEGGSTITQQLVRNTILSEEQFDNTIERKVREAYIAIKIEEIYTKDEILMMYLNCIYYGHSAYGIEAAAQTYFSKSASELTLAEAALLVGLPNAPSYYDPTSNPEGAIERRNKVLSNMLSLGDITQEQYDEAVATELELNVSSTSSTGVDIYEYEYFVQYVKSLLQDEFSTDVLFKGGLTVKTTIDPDIQAAAEEAAISNTELYTSYNSSLQVGMTVVDPDTGYILAMVGGLDYDADDNHINHATTRFMPGSSFKTFTLIAAIEAGMNPEITLSCASPMTFDDYTVQNYGGTNYGTRTLASATAVSSNTAYVQVALEIGNVSIIEVCERLGVDIESANLEDVPSLTLGTGSLNTVEMASAYATLANGGYECEHVAITQITSRTGTILYEYDVDSREQVLETNVAQAVTEVLETVMESGGTGSTGMPDIDQPVAGKTGTTSDVVSLWFCGYTPQYSVAIVVANDDNSSMTSATGGDLHNSQATLPIFKAFMENVLEGVAREEFPTSDEEIEYLDNSEWELYVYKSSSSSSSSSSDEDEEEEEVEEEEAVLDEEEEESEETSDDDSGSSDGSDDDSGSDDSASSEASDSADSSSSSSDSSSSSSSTDSSSSNSSSSSSDSSSDSGSSSETSSEATDSSSTEESAEE